MKTAVKAAHGSNGLSRVGLTTRQIILLCVLGLLVVGTVWVSVPAYRLRHAPVVVDIGTGRTDFRELLKNAPFRGSLMARTQECCWDMGPSPASGVLNSYETVLLSPILPNSKWVNGYAVLEPEGVAEALAGASDWQPVKMDGDGPACSIAAQLRATSGDDGDWTWLRSDDGYRLGNQVSCVYYLEPNRSIVIFVLYSRQD